MPTASAWEGDGGGPVRTRGTYTLSPDGPSRTRVQQVLRRHVRRDAERLRRWLGGRLGGAWVADLAELWEAVSIGLPAAV